MKKTSVYLEDRVAQDLKRAAQVSGRPQADLIREGVERMVAEIQSPPRHFHSMGKGHGPAVASRRWSADELYAKVSGRK